jgi:hypothetical protein
MALPIKLSLAGDGRLVILTPQTVRSVFFQFTEVNREYTGREKFPLNRPLYQPFKLWKYKSKSDGRILRKTSLTSCSKKNSWQETDATLLDALYRSHLDKNKLSHFHKRDIQYIEREINKQIIINNLALVEKEGILLSGYGVCQQVGKNREKVKYIRRYGMIFILEVIMRQTVLVRYHGVLLSSLSKRIQLLFHHRLDFDLTWTCTLESFQPRQIFRVKRIYPCDRFHIVNYG